MNTTNKNKKLIKLCHGDSLRRVSTEGDVFDLTVADIHALGIKTFAEIQEVVHITYLDDEGDTIVVGTDNELQEAVELASVSKRVIKLTLVGAAAVPKERKRVPEEKKRVAESPSAGEDDESPVMVELPCAHPGCGLGAHPRQGHGYCCKKCKKRAKKGKAPKHGGKCHSSKKSKNKKGHKKKDKKKCAGSSSSSSESSSSEGECCGAEQKGAGKRGAERACAFRNECAAFFSDEAVKKALVAAAPKAMTDLLAGVPVAQVLAEAVGSAESLKQSALVQRFLPHFAIVADLAGKLVGTGGIEVWELINELGLLLFECTEGSVKLPKALKGFSRRVFRILKRGLARTGAGIHWGITCDKSGARPIIGRRYTLKGADYDLCGAEYDQLGAEAKRFRLVPAPPLKPFRVLRMLTRVMAGGGFGRGGRGGHGHGHDHGEFNGPPHGFHRGPGGGGFHPRQGHGHGPGGPRHHRHGPGAHHPHHGHWRNPGPRGGEPMGPWRRRGGGRGRRHPMHGRHHHPMHFHGEGGQPVQQQPPFQQERDPQV